VQESYGIPVIAIATLKSLLQFLESSDDKSLSHHRQAVDEYRAMWGVS
jgi:orotate phosphoribosyltransferase